MDDVSVCCMLMCVGIGDHGVSRRLHAVVYHLHAETPQLFGKRRRREREKKRCGKG